MTQNAKCKKRTLQLTHQNLKVINGHFTTVSGHFFANYMNIFQKTEIQTVILRCSTIGIKVTTQNAKTQKSLFLQNCKKTEMEILVFSITFEPIEIWTCYTPQIDRLNLSFVKVTSMVGQKWPEMVMKRPFMSQF